MGTLMFPTRLVKLTTTFHYLFCFHLYSIAGLTEPLSKKILSI